MTVCETVFSEVGGQLEPSSLWQEQEVVNTASATWLKMFLSRHTFSSAGPFQIQPHHFL